MAADIVVIGSFVVGITVRLPRMPYLGETLVADLLDTGPGGKGSNLAVAATRQGAQVALVAKVGHDNFAEMAFQLYQAEGIDAQYIMQTDDEPTAVGLVYLQKSGENTIGFYRGANWCLTAEDVATVASEMEAAKIMTIQLEIPNEAVQSAVELGRQHELTIILNPAPARSLPSDILTSVDILTPNEGEARLLIGLAPDDDSLPLAEVGQRLLDLGPQTVIITLGSQGCLLLQPDQAPHPIPAHPVQVIDTVGAGDTFNAGLAVALAEGQALLDAIRWANTAAALSTTQVGVIPGLPDRTAVMQALNL